MMGIRSRTMGTQAIATDGSESKGVMGLEKGLRWIMLTDLCMMAGSHRYKRTVDKVQNGGSRSVGGLDPENLPFSFSVCF